MNKMKMPSHLLLSLKPSQRRATWVTVCLLAVAVTVLAQVIELNRTLSSESGREQLQLEDISGGLSLMPVRCTNPISDEHLPGNQQLLCIQVGWTVVVVTGFKYIGRSLGSEYDFDPDRCPGCSCTGNCGMSALLFVATVRVSITCWLALMVGLGSDSRLQLCQWQCT